MNSRLCALLILCSGALPSLALAGATPVSATRGDAVRSADAKNAPTSIALTGSTSAQGTTIPAGMNDGPSTVGPLPVVPDLPKARPVQTTSFVDDAQAQTDDTLGPNAGSSSRRSADSLPAAEEDTESLAGTLFRTLLVLGMVIALVYVSLNYGLRKLMGVRAAGGGPGGLVRVVERIPLDPKRSLFVVQAAGEYLLVGGAEDGLNLISKLNSEEVSRLMTEQKRDLASQSPFLAKLLSRKNPPPPTAGA